MSSSKKDFTVPSRRELELTALATGIASTFPSGDVIKINGTGFTKADFLAMVQGFLDPEVAARQGHVTLAKLVAIRKAGAKATAEFIAAARRALVSHFGAQNAETLAAFGVKVPASRDKATGPEMVARTAKANETRQARGTKGAQQKAAIQGAQPSVVVTTQGKLAVAKPQKGASTP